MVASDACRGRLTCNLLIGQWTLDPIGETRGFSRGGQYAVRLALIVDMQVVLSVIGCPNLPVKSAEPDGPKGGIFVAVKCQGAEQVCNGPCSRFLLLLADTHRRRTQAINFLEFIEAAHASSVLFSCLMSSSTVKTVPPVRMAKTPRIDLRLSRTPGALIAIT